MEFDIIKNRKCIYLFGYKPITDQGFIIYDDIINYYSKPKLDKVYYTQYISIIDSLGDYVGKVDILQAIENNNVKEYLLYHNPEFFI